MYEIKVVGFEEAMGAIRAMQTHVKENSSKYWQAVCYAIVDEHGELVAFAKSDCLNLISGRMAIKKAFTSAIWRKPTGIVLDWARGLILDPNSEGLFINPKGDIADLWASAGQPNYEYGFTGVPGGLPIIPPGQERLPLKTCIGAIGVGGAGPGELDEEVAMVGLRYIENALWPPK